jgi:hypothetical protein
MGVIKDLKQRLFGPFLKWLEVNKLGDPFSNDVWASKVFDELKKQSEKEMEFGQMLNAMPDSMFDQYIGIKDLVKPDGSKL